MGNNSIYLVGILNVISRFLVFHCIQWYLYVTINEFTFDDFKHDHTRKIILYYIVLLYCYTVSLHNTPSE